MTGMVGCFRCIGFVQLKRVGRLDRHVSGGQKKCTTLGLVSLSHLCMYKYIYMGF